MKVFFAYQGKQDKHFLEFNVSSSLTVSEFIDFKSIRNNTIKKINSNGLIKSVFFDIANKGFRF